MKDFSIIKLETKRSLKNFHKIDWLFIEICIILWMVSLKDYGFYTFGFSYDGKYFIFAQDAEITISGRMF